MKFLKESYLIEKIVDVKKYYPNIDDRTFNELIALDPTFTNNDSLGTYGKWILNTYKKDPKNFNKGHVRDVLEMFISKKNNLEHKDINYYKSLEDLDATLIATEEAKQSESKRKREISKTKVEDNATKVFEDENYEIWIPNTYEASCKLGRNARWCTATTESDYHYNKYTSQGPLYIILDKNDPNAKYQFHFEKREFNDIYNDPIDIYNFLVNNPAIVDYFDSIGKIDEFVENIAEYGLVDNDSWYAQDLDKEIKAFLQSPKLVKGVTEYLNDHYRGRSRPDTTEISLEEFAETERGLFEESLYRDVISGEGILNHWDYEDTLTLYDIESVYEYYMSNENKETLKEMGYDKHNLEDIIDNDDIWDAIGDADGYARVAGAENQIYKAVIYALEEASPVPLEFKGGVATVDISNPLQIWLKSQVIASDTENTFELESNLDDQIIEATLMGAKVDEPYYGWDDFDEDTFNRELAERLDELR